MNIVRFLASGGSRRALVCAATAAITLAAAAGAASAQPTPEGGVRVRVADLDIRTAYGARILLARIKWAAGQACGDQPLLNDLGERLRFRQCREDAVERAVLKLDAPMVSALAHGSARPLALAGG